MIHGNSSFEQNADRVRLLDARVFAEREVYRSVLQAAEALACSPSEVLAICERGEIHSLIREFGTPEAERLIRQDDLDDYLSKGPNTLMTFEQAKTCIVESTLHVRRPCWRWDLSISFHPQWVNHKNGDDGIHIWVDQGYDGEQYRATDEDLNAKDWYVNQRFQD